jgi:carboxyl-terminal processing protease
VSARAQLAQVKAGAEALHMAIVVLALLLMFAAPAGAEPFTPGQGLDQRMIAEVTGAALAFMAPRTLEAIPTGQLTIWGLRGLTTLDQRLVASLSDKQLDLSLSGRMLLARPPPMADPAAWGDAVAQLSRTAWDVSESVRHAGTEGVLHSFFDELFNHLDPYSRYASPQEAAQEQARRNGSAGLGLDIARNGQGFVVRAVLPGSPAAQAGIKPGEMLSAIDGLQISGADLAAVSALLAGPEDSRVSLTLRGAGRSERVTDLVRAVLTPVTVFAQRQGDLLVIRITGFARDTAELLAREITRGVNTQKPPQGLVLDLRDNRGGLLRQAVSAAQTLAPQGLIAVTAGRAPEATREYRANGSDLAHGLPVVLVVDGRTASAAEVLAAALSDQRRAVVVGSATLGKGLVQTILPLPNGGALSLTWSRVLAPLGWPLQALGVLPQVCTSLGEDALRHNLAELAQGRQPMARSLTRSRTARAPMPPAEILEIRNACPASEGRDSDMAAAKFLIDTPVAYETALIIPPPPP